MVDSNLSSLFTKLMEATSEASGMRALKTHEGWVRCLKAEIKAKDEIKK